MDRSRAAAPTPSTSRFFSLASFWLVLALLWPGAMPQSLSADEVSDAAEAVETGTTIAHWPSFRGHLARGIGPLPLATSWNLEDGTNVAWRTPIPGLGHSSPVIWGEKIFLTTAVAEEGEAELKVGIYGDGWSADDKGPQSWRVLALDRSSGEVLWEREALNAAPEIQRHPKASHANSTPATDGERLIAFFGSEGLFAYSMEGELLWQKDFGVLHSGSFMMPVAQWGFASSPVLHEGKVIIQADVLQGSFLAVLDATTGEEIWRRERDEFPGWGTPTLHRRGSRTFILVNGYKHMGGYDFEDGSELWKLSGGGDVPVPTPVVAHGMVYLTSAHGGPSPVYAVDLDAHGDLTPPKKGSPSESDAAESDAAGGLVWANEKGGAYMQTPLVVGDLLYVCRDNGILSCLDAHTGERHYQERLTGGDSFSASPVAAGGKLYFTSETGEVHVVDAGTRLGEVRVSSLGETAMATPAIAGDTLYFRTRHHLLAIREGAELKRSETATGGATSP